MQLAHSHSGDQKDVMVGWLPYLLAAGKQSTAEDKADSGSVFHPIQKPAKD